MPPKKAKSAPKLEAPLPDPATLPTPSLDSQTLRMSYRIARGEQGVLTFEPYKSLLLPYWRFRNLPIAKTSSTQLKSASDHYVNAGDFVGADMARKFIQMGMTRAKRYANHKGGRKYERVKGVAGEEGRVVGADGKGKQLAKSEGHEGKEEKLAVSELFKGVWRECVEDEGYQALKKSFLAEQKEWDRAQKVKKEEKVKEEEESGEDEMVGVKQESDVG